MEDEFLRLSAVLTGFDTAELADSGMLDSYRRTVSEQVGAEALERLIAALAEVGGDPQDLADPALLELARAVCSLWYLGAWSGLPEATCRALGVTNEQLWVRPSASAYAQGLVWRAMGSHAPGTRQPGFGSWAAPPLGDRG